MSTAVPPDRAASEEPPTFTPSSARYQITSALSPERKQFLADAYYYKGHVFLKVGEEWVGLSVSMLAELLLSLDFTECPKTAKAMAREVFLRSRMHHPLSFVGELAGLPGGVHGTAHGRVLVPVGLRLLRGNNGSWYAIERYLRSLLGKDQMLVFMANLKVAREILRSGDRRTVTVQFFVGSPGCGKSVILRLIAMALGGRCANAFRFISGATDYNSDLAGVETLLVDDDMPHDPRRSTVRMTARIKGIMGGAAHRIEGKGRNAVAASLTQFVVGAVNENHAAIRAIPRLSEDFADKITLYYCRKGELPATRATGGALLCETLSAELPAFLHAVDSMEIPERLRDDRYGVKAQHAPEVLSRLAEADTVKVLLGIVALLSDHDKRFEGRSAELHAQLLESTTTKRDYAEFIRLHMGAAPIQHLGELLNEASESHPEQVRALPPRDGHRRWLIVRDPGAAVAPVAPQGQSSVESVAASSTTPTAPAEVMAAPAPTEAPVATSTTEPTEAVE